ncbi:ABC transporter permease [Paenibacillus contaminans]|uniref:Peptide ABC transporter permease n=1 Tax=Paenibacillus contaminans TaxID=450362 RepID=A0A329MTF4_9BACL|nr:ABC transporter permease [Paenibacillus contaminans]RAV22820.1 peptide ABC transporter permease [Paenibacillus contaminans]
MGTTAAKSSLALRNWEKLSINKLAMVGFAIISVMILCAILAPVLSSYKPDEIDLSNRLMPPSGEHLLGTDKLGRDVFARLLYGARVSILIGLSGALGGALIGTVIGCFSGYLGGWFDKITLRISEIFMTFPQLILVLILVVYIGQGLFNLILIFSITGWTGTYRLVRGRFLSLREENYVDACRAFGIGELSIMFRHILPNTLSPVIVTVTLTTAGYILAESGLSFLGLGVPSGIPTWGNIINAAKAVDVIRNNPWLWLPPGLAISLFVMGVNFLGDGLRDVLDPNQ